MKFNFDYINDIHLDFWVPINSNILKYEKRTREFANSLIPPYHSDVLILGGDIGHYNKQNIWFLDELRNTYNRIFIVFGNHDYYLVSTNQKNKYKGNSFNRTKEIKDWIDRNSGIDVLDGSLFEIDGVKIGGTGMWYDFSFGMKELNHNYDEVYETWWNKSNDSRRITRLDRETYFEEEYEKLSSIINDADILISHVGPDWRLSPYISDDNIHNSYYFFDGSDLIKECYKNNKNKLWCFGHVHMELDKQEDLFRWVSYALGYPDEDKFKKFKTIEID